MPTSFLDQVLTSSLPGQVAKRFSFADGEVGVVYTTIWNRASATVSQVLLYVATFPSSYQNGYHDFGLDFLEQPVSSAEEAAQVLAHFQQEQASMFRASCRA